MRHRFTPPILAALVALAVFAPALGNGFVEWDDHVNFVDNPHFRGLGPSQLRWMLGAFLMGQWIPVTWLTLGLDHVLWGMRPLGYHLTSVVLHGLNAALFTLVASRLLGAALPGLPAGTLRLGAAGAGLFFAIHPLRAESVAWVTERRDVVSGVFFLLTVLAYLEAARAEDPRRRRWLALSIGCYVLAVGSKAIVVTLPILLLLLDLYPLRRLPWPPSGWRSPGLRPVLAEKLPYVALALGGAVMAVHAMRANSFLTPLERLPLADRVPVMLHSLWFYVAKTLVPTALSPLYELPPRVHLLERHFAMSAAVVVLGAATLLVLRRRWPAGLAMAAAYGILLAPVSGVVHNGHQLVHDRYSYLACLPWALLFGAGVAWLLDARDRGVVRPAVARLATVAIIAWVGGLALLAVHQVRVWRDTDTLWRFAVDADPTCAICQGNLGVSLYNRRLPDLAIPRLERALELRPDHVKTNGSLGLALMAAGRPAEAATRFARVLERYPNDQDTRINLAVAFLNADRPLDALRELGEVLRLDARHAGAHTNVGAALVDLGRPAEALGPLRQALDLKPDMPQPRVGLARAYAALGSAEAARQEYDALQRLDPRLASGVAPFLVAVW